MTTLHYLGQDDKNEVLHDFLCHMLPLALALAPCDVNSIVNGVIAVLWSR